MLSEVSDELYVIQECGTIFPGIVPGHYQASPTMKKYFENVSNAQSYLFGNSYVNNNFSHYLCPTVGPVFDPVQPVKCSTSAHDGSGRSEPAQRHI